MVRAGAGHPRRYATVVLPPGHRKSAVFASVTRPFKEFEAGARYLLRWIERADIASFSGRELYRATRGRFRQVDELAPALAALDRHGYVRRRPSWARPGPGRKPSPIYDVNPHARAPRPDRPSGARPASRAADSGLSDHSVQGELAPDGDLSTTHDDELPR